MIKATNTHPENNGNNAVIATIKRLGKKPVFGIALVLAAFSLGLKVQPAIQTGKIVNILSLLLPLAEVIGLAVFSESCNTKKYTGVKSYGITTVLVTEILTLAVQGIIIVVGLISVLNLSPDEIDIESILKDYGYFADSATSESLNDAIIPITVAILILSLAFLSAYCIGGIIGLGRIRSAILTGEPCGKIPKYLAILLVVLSVVSAIDAVSYFSNGFSSAMQYLAAAVEYGLFAYCIHLYNAEIEALNYAKETVENDFHH